MVFEHGLGIDIECTSIYKLSRSPSSAAEFFSKESDTMETMKRYSFRMPTSHGAIGSGRLGNWTSVKERRWEKSALLQSPIGSLFQVTEIAILVQRKRVACRNRRSYLVDLMWLFGGLNGLSTTGVPHMILLWLD